MNICYGEKFYYLTYWENIWNQEGSIFFKVFSTEKLEDGLPFFWNDNGNIMGNAHDTGYRQV